MGTSVNDLVWVKTYNPDTSFGPLPEEMARSYVGTRGGEAGGFFIVRGLPAADDQDKLAEEKKKRRIWDAVRDAG